MKSLATAAVAVALAVFAGRGTTVPSQTPQTESKTMELGNFSVSLTVKDLSASQTFYEKLGFVAVAGAAAQNWLVLQNGTTKIGLFQGMFEKNLLTFNPGWSDSAEPLKAFVDVRDIQKRLEASGLKPAPRADESSTGPASFMLQDPDGNPILFDQHVPKPGR